MTKQFYTRSDLGKDEGQWSFIAELAWLHSELFQCEDHYCVEDKLRKFGCYGPNDVLDCEYSCFYIYFKKYGDGRRFITKLNKYLNEKQEMLNQFKET